jgi:hypothetical protein
MLLYAGLWPRRVDNSERNHIPIWDRQGRICFQLVTLAVMCLAVAHPKNTRGTRMLLYGVADPAGH